jgi:integrase
MGYWRHSELPSYATGGAADVGGAGGRTGAVKSTPSSTPELDDKLVKVKENLMLKKLTVKFVETVKKPGRYGDGGGLWLQVSDTCSKSWVFRYTVGSQERWMGLGAFPDVGLAEVRKQALECRRLREHGKDPIDYRNAEALKTAAHSHTFQETADAYFQERRDSISWHTLRNWHYGFNAHVLPAIGDVPVNDIDTHHIVAMLTPIWRKTPDRAWEMRRLTKCIIDAAVAKGWRERNKFNPATWEGHLQHNPAFPAVGTIRQVMHYPCLPWRQIGEFIQDLRARGAAIAEDYRSRNSQHAACAAALEFQILTAVRPNEAYKAEWSEIDLDAGLWIVPAERMKGLKHKKKDHRVPLSEQAIAVLQKQRGKHETLVFPGLGGRAPINIATVEKFIKTMPYTSDVGDPLAPHGFRSCFRDWVAETTTKYGPHLAELALAHHDRNATQAAYLRTDYLEQRRPLMDDWGRFCDVPYEPDEKVIPLHRKESA